MRSIELISDKGDKIRGTELNIKSEGKISTTMTGIASINKLMGYSFIKNKFTVTRKLQLI